MKYLQRQARIWPTPVSSQDKQGAARRNRKQGQTLVTVANKALWPTASARDWKGAPEEPWGSNARPLNEVAKTWPTPRACSGDRSSGLNRTEMVNAWGTPSTMDAKGRTYTRDGGQKDAERNALAGQAISLSRAKKSSTLSHSGHPDLPMQVSGAKSLHAPERLARLSLNPIFVEWLMGWPPGWTDCGSPVTGFARWLQRQRTALAELSWNYETAPDAEAPMQQLELV
jgi:hypothetical protein